MSRKFTIDEALECTQRAFAPFSCVAEHYDYQYRIRFRVYGPGDEHLVEMDDLTRPMFQDASRLEAAIVAARRAIEAKGFILDAWTFPTERA